ncbi:MAG: division/cell wall cluster transcriptional repressor MraZ [Flavobacteriales bacterium]|nr:MAG: division/cell wall cluster transcriptional repressor MraZ [Flavobacteriales bacterium TMED96]RZP12153.1 MAG: division/cell wall cluster transcriptional repressor MraZ [Flavobacteriales bacterium]
MNHFIGTYECKIDVKGRILIPSALKKQITISSENGFVIKRGLFNKCLDLYPFDQWKFVMNKIDQLNRFNKKNIDFIRRFTAGVKMVDIDTNGRLLIPKDLIKHACIRKDIVLSAAVNILEIWDKKLYEEIIDEAKVDFSSLAEEVMGDDNE